MSGLQSSRSTRILAEAILLFAPLLSYGNTIITGTETFSASPSTVLTISGTDCWMRPITGQVCTVHWGLTNAYWDWLTFDAPANIASTWEPDLVQYSAFNSGIGAPWKDELHNWNHVYPGDSFSGLTYYTNTTASGVSVGDYSVSFNIPWQRSIVTQSWQTYIETTPTCQALTNPKNCETWDKSMFDQSVQTGTWTATLEFHVIQDVTFMLPTFYAAPGDTVDIQGTLSNPNSGLAQGVQFWHTSSSDPLADYSDTNLFTVGSGTQSLDLGSIIVPQDATGTIDGTVDVGMSFSGGSYSICGVAGSTCSYQIIISQPPPPPGPAEPGSITLMGLGVLALMLRVSINRRSHRLT